MIYVPTIFTDFLGRILSGDELDVNFDFGTLDLYHRSIFSLDVYLESSMIIRVIGCIRYHQGI